MIKPTPTPVPTVIYAKLDIPAFVVVVEVVFFFFFLSLLYCIYSAMAGALTSVSTNIGIGWVVDNDDDDDSIINAS